MKLFLCALLLVTRVFCAPVLSVLKNIDNLSTLNFHIQASTTLTNLLQNADNFTFLAPSNDAFDDWLSSNTNNGNVITEAVIEQTLLYHLLKGGYPTIGISSKPQFAVSNLPNGLSANVTGGQVVEAVADAEGRAQFVSGNKTVSTISTPDILCTGGIIHIVRTALHIPPSIPTLAQQAQMKIFISILQSGGFLSSSNAALVAKLLDSPDMITFVPNTLTSITAFGNLSATNPGPTRLNGIFNNHFVPGTKGYSTSLKDGQKLTSFQGQTLTITKRGNETFVNGARIVSSDFIVDNGVVHTIDGLLDPNNVTVPPPLSSTASKGSGLSNSLLGAIISLGVLLPVLLAIFLFWYCKLRKNPKSVDPFGKHEDDTNKDFNYPSKFAELDTPISMRSSQLPFRQVHQKQSVYEMPAFEMDATSLRGKNETNIRGNNKALPMPP